MISTLKWITFVHFLLVHLSTWWITVLVCAQSNRRQSPTLNVQNALMNDMLWLTNMMRGGGEAERPDRNNNNGGQVILQRNFHQLEPQISDVIRQILRQLNATAIQVRRGNSQTTTMTTTTPTPTTTLPTTSTEPSRPQPSAPRRVSPSNLEGKLRLVGGHTLFEGNVEINHFGQWGSICDDEWDLTEAHIACRQLGFVLGAIRATTDSRYGKSRRTIWMDNLFCTGQERTIQECPFDGWRQHDCSMNEAAGVVCRTDLNQHTVHETETTSPKPPTQTSNVIPVNVTLTHNNNVELVEEKIQLESLYGDDIQVRLVGEVPNRFSRVEVQLNQEWHVLCGDGWNLNEANVVCAQLGLGSAESANHLKLPDHEQSFKPMLSGVECEGTETKISQCTLSKGKQRASCPDSYDNVAAVACVAGIAIDAGPPHLPDLVPDAVMLEHSAYLEDRSILFLQCAMEENCLSRSAYELDKSDSSWIYETRRLLRFTASIRNIGKVDFRPFMPKHQWVWHSCHRHYHSMEVFAHFDVLDTNGHRVAEGHKASFCLEDNACVEGAQSKYACANYGDQGISVGCVDIYKYDLDCQWVDITDIQPGEYLLKVTINPEFKVPEVTFDNNAALCHFLYTPIGGYVTNCTVVRP